jgi:hypothetical protein
MTLEAAAIRLRRCACTRAKPAIAKPRSPWPEIRFRAERRIGEIKFALRAGQRARHWQAMATRAVREKIAERTRMAMTDPSVRERILAGMAQRSVEVELRLFHVLWAALSADARKRITTEFGQSGCL